jgi:hypothetical protein
MDMHRKIFNQHKKFSATISVFILSSSFFSTTFISAPSANAWSSAQSNVSVFGGTLNDSGVSIAVDSSGNIYTTGFFRGTADFDPGVGVTNLTAIGFADVFISKLDSTGALIWAKSFGGDNLINSNSIAVDNSGNVYTAGYFIGTADFDPGPGTTNLITVSAPGVFNYDVFVSKLDSSGNFIWAKSFGGSSLDWGTAIAVDDSGSVYTTGFFEGIADFDPGVGVTNLTAVDYEDAFVSKLDSTGALIWAKSFGARGTSFGERDISITVDNSGNIYTTGAFAGTEDFDPGAGTTNFTSAGGNDIFVSKLDSSGNLVWAKGFGGTTYEHGFSISVDNSGNVYTTGDFAGTADFDPGVGVTNLTTVGYADAFVSKLDSTGALIWAKGFGLANTYTYGSAIAVDSSGNIYTTGGNETLIIDPFSLNPNFFVSKLNSSGVLLWEKSYGGSGLDASFSVAVDGSGNVYATGYFEGTVDFDPGVGTSNFTSAGINDAFVLKLSPSGEDIAAEAARVAAANAEAARVAAANAEAARVAAANAEAARKAKEQKELMEILAIIPKIGGLSLSLGDVTQSLLSTKCVKGKTVKYVKKGAKCPRGFVKKK